jgi:polysaccharide transporter, PST family
MRMAGKIAYSSVATAVSVAGGLLRNKIFAAFLSLNLFGILSIGQQSLGLLSSLFAFGLPLGITTLAARIASKSQEEQLETVSRIVVLSFCASLVSGLVLGAILLIDPVAVSRAVTAKADYALPVGILLLSTPFLVAETCLFALMEGMGKVKEIVLFKIVPIFVTLPLYYVLASEFGLTGVAIGLLLSEFLLLVVALFLNRRLIQLRRSAFHVKEVFRGIIKIAVLSVAVGAGWLIADFLVKRYMLQTLGEASNGIIQSVAKITDLYPTIVLAWLTLHIFPTVARSIDDPSAIARALERTLIVAVAIIVPIILVLFAFRGLVLEIVYKKEFSVAVDYFGAMLVTGIPKVTSWVLGLALLPMGLKKQWLYSAMVFILAYLAGIKIGLELGFETYAIPFSAALSWCLQTGYTVFALRKSNVFFSATFMLYLLAFSFLTLLIAASILWLPLLLIAVFFYGVMIWRYGAFKELRTRYNEYRNRRAP